MPTDTPPSWLTDIPADQPLALVTLGSVFTGDLGFFAWAAQAVARLHYMPVVVIGRNPIEPDKKAELKAALPPNTRLLNWIPFDHVLPRTRLMVHHGGMGTTHAAVIHGIPQMAVPHAADQRGNARRIAQAKVGFNLTAHEVRHGALLEGATAIDQRCKCAGSSAANWPLISPLSAARIKRLRHSKKCSAVNLPSAFYPITDHIVMIEGRHRLCLPRGD